MPQVSIVIVNFNFPHNITRLLPSLKKTVGVDYEVVVVDNGSEPDVVKLLMDHQDQGLIDTLVLEPVNRWFEEGNNIGVRNSDPASEFILLLNNDTEILHGAWLRCMIEWAEGVPEVLFPYAWSSQPAQPKNIRRGIVSIDWGWDRNMPGDVRPEGWCCLIRREAWREMNPDYGNGLGILKMWADTIRDGHPAGVLCQYKPYIVHYGGGSRPADSKYEPPPPPKLSADPKAWWAGLECETLDFTFGPTERQSYLSWSRGIEQEYQNACTTKSDMNEHMPVLFELARECSHVVEGGVRYVVSTWAWIWGCMCHNGGEVHSYCWTKIPEIERAIEICKEEGLPWHFYDGDWLQREIPETDLIFFDTNHEAWQLREELRLHAPKARKYLVFHDTVTFGEVGADGKSPGLMGPINELVAEGNWKIKERYFNCNGLLVMERTQ
jgi:glycosyltransferase involved in cell wall biosynthesis